MATREHDQIDRPTEVDATPPSGVEAVRARHLMPLSRRLAIALVTMASLATLLAVVAQDSALSRDLESAVAARLDRSARAGRQVVEEHLRAQGERYRAIARTPQLRATLEVNDPTTLRFLADELRRQQGAAAIAFVDPDGAILASSGGDAFQGFETEMEEEFLHASLDEQLLYAATRVPLETRGQSFGSLIAYEVISSDRLANWSELCGATIALSFGERSPADREKNLVRPIHVFENATLEASSGLDAERAAVENARRQLVAAGTAALGVSIFLCFVLAKSIVRPIDQILEAVERIRRGDLATSIQSRRGDEIGDVARGIDRMARDLATSRAELDRRIEALDRSETHLANAQRIARISSFEVDLQSGAVSGSREFFELMGFEPTQSRSKLTPLDLLEQVHEEDREAVRATVQECIRTGMAARMDHRVVVGSGERVMYTQLEIVENAGQTGRSLEGTVQDVTERRRIEKQIRFLSYHDNLTGLGNRLHFNERLGIAIGHARRNDAQIGILVLDLDDFKRVNDTLGHSVGDKLLQLVADRIIAALREGNDSSRIRDPAEDASLSRLGGDEFTLMVPQLRDPSVLASIAQRILDALGEPMVLDGHELVVGACIGIATWPQDGSDIDALMRNADSAMYHAKSSGRNAYRFYEQSMNAAALDRLEIETRLRRAIEEDTLEVHFQPRVSLATGRTCGFEALTRWQDPELGSISPAEFIPIAEQTGLIVPLGRNVIRRACLQALEWERSELGFDGRVSINVSACQFRVVDVAREIASALAETLVNPLRLEIEVTESVVLHDEEHVIEVLNSIREMGVTIAMDDFGTGYSSLSYLRRLPLDVIKIDMAFIRGIARSDEDAALARAIIAMADALGLAVVAEGVESVAQRDLLRSWGCDEIQGFLVSQALPAHEASTFLEPR